ncbi:MAG: hypothetical protein GY928_08195 [Colwellia sp.]|nr:hypothetical protein [Colwellia sp.]
MDKVKKEYLYLVFALFFTTTLIVNVCYAVSLSLPMAFGTEVFNLILALISILMYKVKYQNIDLVVTIILLATFFIKLLVDKTDLVDMTILTVYISFLILRQVKVSLVSISVLIAFIFIFNTISLIREKGSIAGSINTTLLTITCIITFIFIHIKEMKLSINISDKYKLDKKEMQVLKLITTYPSPTTKEMASKLKCSDSNILGITGKIYKKLDLDNSGNRKVDLVLKLSAEGFI